jgi:hypothetical protein
MDGKKIKNEGVEVREVKDKSGMVEEEMETKRRKESLHKREEENKKRK